MIDRDRYSLFNNNLIANVYPKLKANDCGRNTSKGIYLSNQYKIAKFQQKAWKSLTNSVRAENFSINMKSITSYFKPISSINALLYPPDEVGGESTKRADGQQGWGVKSQGGERRGRAMSHGGRASKQGHKEPLKGCCSLISWGGSAPDSKLQTSLPAGVTHLRGLRLLNHFFLMSPRIQNQLSEPTEPPPAPYTSAGWLSLISFRRVDWEGGWGEVNEVA